MLERYLSGNGFDVRAVGDSQAADRLLDAERFDVVVLDLMLRGESGLDICARWRHRGATIPILMLTARGDPVDRILGLEMGADDYLPKPFNPRELLARLQAMVRRAQMSGATPAGAHGREVKFGHFRLDPVARRLLRDDEPIAITTGEFSLLLALASHPGRPLGRERLLELAHGRDHDATDRSVDVQILRLRRLIEEDPAAPRYIQTVRGFGYLFAPDGEAAP
ncbi:two-component system response regulator OmpR [soil metagenome]